MNKSSITIVAALALMVSLNAFAELDIRNPWIKNLPPSVPLRAGYMTIHNSQTHAIVIVSIRSEAFARIEIHRSIEQDGMMSMVTMPNIRIEAGASVQLAPGGLHLMMMNPYQPTRVGDIVNATIILEDGSEHSLKMQVKK